MDLRLIPSHPTLFELVLSEYCNLVNSLDYKPDAIAGIMSAGVPFATGIAIREKIPLLQIRAEKKAHGTKKMIEGILPNKGSKIVLIDDLISTGVSKLMPTKILRDKGMIVDDLIVLIDRTNSDGKMILKNNKLRLHSSFTLEHILHELKDLNIPTKELKIINEAIKIWDS